MAVLNTRERKSSATWTDSDGAHFPMPDKAHARNALARIKWAPESKKAVIKRRAERILGHKTRSMSRGR
jgi:hypothetical protein